jgi:cytochrome P450
LHSDDIAVRIGGAASILAYLRDYIGRRRAAPTDDLISRIVGSKVGDRPVSDDEIIGMCFLLFVAGLDTVTSALGMHFHYLAENSIEQDRLRANPALVPDAVEELLRAFSIIHMPRRITKDVKLAGAQLKAGDYISCPTMGANLDPHEFPNPNTVDFTREAQRHVAFSYGPHRCIGSHLARRELGIAFQEWLSRTSSFGLKPGFVPVVRGGSVFGIDELDLVWTKPS